MTRSDEDTSAAWTTRSSVGLIALVSGAAISLIWLVHPYYDAYPDASMYIVSARSLAAGEGYTYLGDPFTLRPPGFPALLVPVLTAFGTQFKLLNLYVASFGILCVALLYSWARPRLGEPLAFGVGALVWLNPAFQRLCNRVMSDVPGAAMMLGCLLLARWADRRPSVARDLLLGVCIAGAAYVRTVNILLVPAILLARLWRHRDAADERAPFVDFLRSRAAVLVVVPILVLLPWGLRNAAVADTAASEQTRNYSYWVALLHTDPGDPDSETVTSAELLKRTPLRAGQILTTLGSALDGHRPGWIHVLLGAVALSCWLLALLRHRDAGDLFVVCVLPILTVYFAFEPRLALPVYLIVVVAVAEVLRSMARTWVGPTAGPVLAALVVGVVAIADFDFRGGWERIARAHGYRSEACEYVARTFPPDVALAGYTGSHYQVFLERPVYSLKFAMARRGLPGAEEVLARHGVGGVIVRAGPGSGGRVKALLQDLSSRHGVERSFGHQHVIRIDRSRNGD